MSFTVRYSAAARADLKRLYAYRLERAATIEDLAIADDALAALETAIESLSRSPFICRKAADSAFVREMLIPFDGSGYVALFEIEDKTLVTILAVRHQLEDDYY